MTQNKSNKAIDSVFSKISASLAGGNLEDYNELEVDELLKPFKEELLESITQTIRGNPMLEALAQRYLDGIDQTPNLPELTGDILSRWINNEYTAIIAKGLKIELTEQADSYADSKALFDDIEQNNHVFIFALYNEHPLWDEETNIKFRAVHDYKHHFESGTSSLGFSLHGEFEAYQKAKDDLFNYLWEHESVPTLEIYPILDKILFSEIVLQASVKHFTGEFAPQKIVF